MPIVLVIFILLAMLAISFGFLARAEYSGMAAQARLQQARFCAMGGLEGAALLLRQHFNEPALWYNNPALFQDREVYGEGSEEDRRAWRFSLVGYNLDSDQATRYGITDEAGKLNLNVASPDQLYRLIAPRCAPGMAESLVASLLDWRESGSEARPGGAKDTYYMMLTPPYRCKQGPLDTVEELLLVKGFTADIVYGEDMNRNGMLDANEDDGDGSLPLDNGDGVLDRGLYPYVTVYSREPEVTDGNPYMPRVNMTIWPEGVADKLRPELAAFLVQARDGKADFGKTPANLVGMQVGKGGSTFVSPATEEDLPAVMDLLTTGYHVHDDGFVYGRINVNTASRTVLGTIGKLTPEEIDAILSVRNRLTDEARKTTAWLVTEKVLTLDKYKEVAYLFTARSYQFTVESIGYGDYDGLQCRLQTVMELRLPRVQYVYFRDLTEFGASYRLGEFEQDDVIVTQESGRD